MRVVLVADLNATAAALRGPLLYRRWFPWEEIEATFEDPPLRDTIAVFSAPSDRRRSRVAV